LPTTFSFCCLSALFLCQAKGPAVAALLWAAGWPLCAQGRWALSPGLWPGLCCSLLGTPQCPSLLSSSMETALESPASSGRGARQWLETLCSISFVFEALPVPQQLILSRLNHFACSSRH